jgi:hypothetical protein
MTPYCRDLFLTSNRISQNTITKQNNENILFDLLMTCKNNLAKYFQVFTDSDRTLRNSIQYYVNKGMNQRHNQVQIYTNAGLTNHLGFFFTATFDRGQPSVCLNICTSYKKYIVFTTFSNQHH